MTRQDTVRSQQQIQREQQQLDRAADADPGDPGKKTDVPQTGHRPHPSEFSPEQLVKPGAGSPDGRA